MTSGLLAVVLLRWMRYVCFYVDVLLHMHSVPSLDLFFLWSLFTLDFWRNEAFSISFCPQHFFSLGADLSCVLIWVVGLKSLQVSWKNRWLGRWEWESLFALLLPPASQLTLSLLVLERHVPKIQVTPACRSVFCSSGVFFLAWSFREKGGAIFWSSGVPQQSEELWGDALLSLRASLSTGIEDVRFGYAD